MNLLDLRNHRSVSEEDCEFVWRKDRPSMPQIDLSIAAALETSVMVIAEKLPKTEQH